MFICKFCLREMDRHYESKSHYGMCKNCYTRSMKYKRIMASGGYRSPKDLTLIKTFERQCRHNKSINAYVPKMYFDGVPTTLSVCRYCGGTNVKVYPHSTNMCYDCGKIQNTYSGTVARVERKLGWVVPNKDGSAGYTYDKARETIAEIEEYYEKMLANGYKVPGLFMQRRSDDTNGGVH